MEYIEIFKLIGIIVSTIGAIVVANYNLNQSKKIRCELIENFEIALKIENKHSTCELFRLLHGLRMSYDDICYLVKDDHVVQIIYALKKTPGMVKFVDGKFQITDLFKNKYVKKFDKFSTNILLYASIFIWFLSIFGIFLLKGTLMTLSFVMFIISFAMFIDQKNEYNYNKMIDDIVSKNI